MSKPDKRKVLTSDDKFDLTEAKASYVAMPVLQRLALWLVLGMILLGIIGDLVF